MSSYPPIRSIDHIVYATPDLEQSIEEITDGLGIRPVIGGRHLTKGTKNAVLNLGGACYLEILAKDEKNQDVTSSRWMGIDEITGPRVTRFCLLAQNIEQDAKNLKDYDEEMGVIEEGTRKLSDGNLLRWNMILPLAKPAIDLVPFVCQWPEDSIHPTEKLEEAATLDFVRFGHPNPEVILPVFSSLGLDYGVSKTEEPEIRVVIKGPSGIIELR